MASASENVGKVGGAAATGAAIGSAFPGYGTIIGAGVGALVGLGAVLYDELTAEGIDPETAKIIANDYQAREAPMDRQEFASVLARAKAADAGLAGQQQTYIDTLRAQAEGRGVPSLAQMQLQQALARNQANAAGTMAAQRGVNPALAARLVGQQSASMAQDAAGQAAMLRAQEQMAAQQALGQALVATRGQEQNLYGTAGQLAHNQNALGVQNFQQTQAINANIAEANRQARMRAAEIKDTQDRSASAGMADAAAGVATTYAKSGGVGSGGDDTPPTYYEIGAAHGAIVPGSPKMPGVDHPANDTVPAKLTPGEIVLPLSVTSAPDAPGRAAAFVQRILENARREQILQSALARGGR